MVQLYQVKLECEEKASILIGQYTFAKKFYSGELDAKKSRMNIIENQDTQLDSIYISKVDYLKQEKPFLILGSSSGSIIVIREMGHDNMTSVVDSI